MHEIYKTVHQFALITGSFRNFPLEFQQCHFERIKVIMWVLHDPRILRPVYSKILSDSYTSPVQNG